MRREHRDESMRRKGGEGGGIWSRRIRRGNYCSDTQGGTERGSEARHGLKDMLVTSPRKDR